MVGTELLGSALVQVLWCLQAFVSDEHIYIYMPRSGRARSWDMPPLNSGRCLTGI